MVGNEKKLKIEDYIYPLPPDRIALYPLPKRDDSKLLVYKDQQITHDQFFNLAKHIPENSLLFFNDTKVIPARLHFKKETGAEIEIFLLNPVAPSPLLVDAMQAHESCIWKCTIGNLKRWTDGTKLSKSVNSITLEAELIHREEGLVKFSWGSEFSFAEIVDKAGETPLPPYLKRSAEEADRDRYQTIYSHYEGAVAAPTAGLHFTDEVFESIRRKGVQTDFLTLHVSAGTFQPIKTQNASEHIMHREQIIVTKKNLENLLLEERLIIPVGTTSMRTLESLYWFGAKLLKDDDAEFIITQHEPYDDYAYLPSKKEAITIVSDYMANRRTDMLIGETSIYIMPGYTFRICNALITNFHLPASTLILLVAAFAGPDWKKVYHEALQNNYRFLSYGDSSLLMPGGLTPTLPNGEGGVLRC